MLAAEVDQIKIAAFLHDLGVITRDARIGNHQIFVDLAANVKRSAIQNDVLLLASLHEDERGKHSGAGAMVTNGVQGHGWKITVPFVRNRRRKRGQAANLQTTGYSSIAFSRKPNAGLVKRSRRANPSTKTGNIKLV